MLPGFHQATGVPEGICGAHSKKDLEAKSRKVYPEHNERVKATIPAEKLLLYKLGSGWQPLCSLLGKPVPDVPFPRVNETDMVNDYVGIAVGMGLKSVLKRWAFYACAIAIPIALLWETGSFEKSKPGMDC
jgi:hypothetical protein